MDPGVLRGDGPRYRPSAYGERSTDLADSVTDPPTNEAWPAVDRVKTHGEWDTV